MRETQRKQTNRGLIVILIILLLLVLLFWWPWGERSPLSKGVRADQISIRQSDGYVQWQFMDGKWQNIVSLADLRGAKGEKGDRGDKGDPGEPGKDGQPGRDGSASHIGNGRDGQAGPKGDRGDKGEPGAAGPAGTPGASGPQGPAGTPGPIGPVGPQGVPGAVGPAGPVGPQGPAGADGREIELQKGALYVQWRYQGDTQWHNLIAYTDLKGEKGDRGDKGEPGAAGPVGPQGLPGAVGPIGPQGPAGMVGPQGLPGVAGPVGPAGPAATLTIGTVSRTACVPTASISGAAPHQMLHLGVPGLPPGGKVGQVLAKNSADDCDASWVDTHEVRGTGMPEKKVAAPIGTYYTDTIATNGAIRWVKTTDGGDTGWKVIYGDTGWRKVDTLVGAGVKTVRQQIRRINNTIYISVTLDQWGAGWTAGGTGMPPGLRTGLQVSQPITVGYGIKAFGIVQVNSSIGLSSNGAQTTSIGGTGQSTINVAVAVSGDAVPWPESLPGTPL